jgi:hypothetical protein
MSQETEDMGHIRIFSSDGIRFNPFSLAVLIPGILYPDRLSVLRGVFESFQLHKHTVCIGGEVPALTIDKVQYRMAFFIQGFIV